MRVILPLRQQKKQQAFDGERPESDGPRGGEGEPAGSAEVDDYSPEEPVIPTTAASASEPYVVVQAAAEAEAATASSAAVSSPLCPCEREEEDGDEGRSVERSSAGSSEPTAARKRGRVPSPELAAAAEFGPPSSAVVAPAQSSPSASSAAPSWNSPPPPPPRSSPKQAEKKPAAAAAASLVASAPARIEPPPLLEAQKPSGYVDRRESSATAVAASHSSISAASGNSKDGKQSRKRRHVSGTVKASTPHVAAPSSAEFGITFSADSKPSSVQTGNKATATATASSAFKKPRRQQQHQHQQGPPTAAAAAASHQSSFAAASGQEGGLGLNPGTKASSRKVSATTAAYARATAASTRSENTMGRLPPHRHHASASWGGAGGRDDDDPAASSAAAGPDVRGENENDPPIELVRQSSNNYDDDDRRDENDPASPWAGVPDDYDASGGGLRERPQPLHPNSSSSSSSSSAAPRHRQSAASPRHRPVFTGPISISAFEQALKKRGLEMAEQEGDGNCLFRAVSLQVYGDPNNHAEVRRRALDFMAEDEAHFSQFITDEPFREYISRKRADGVHGNNPEIQAVSELYNRPVEVFVPENGAKPINIFHAEYKTSDAPIRLSYHDGNHYNAVIDPLCPTAGLGLGLPGLEPGLADKLQMEKAKEESDRLQVQKVAAESHKAEVDRVMKESKRSHDLMYKKKAFALSDLEATDFDLEQAVLESSLESYMNEQGRKQSHRDRRRQQGNSSPRYSSAVASSSSRLHEEPIPTAASMAVAAPASAASAGTGAAGFGDDGVPSHSLDGPQDEYPPTVQELVMNGFELSKVLRAYELVGDNFDALLSFLMSNAN